MREEAFAHNLALALKGFVEKEETGNVAWEWVSLLTPTHCKRRETF